MPYHDLTPVKTHLNHCTAHVKLQLNHYLARINRKINNVQGQAPPLPARSKESIAAPAQETYRQKVNNNRRVDGWFRCTELGCNPDNDADSNEPCGESSLFYEKGDHPFGVIRCRYPCCIKRSCYGHGVVITAGTPTSPTIMPFRDMGDTISVLPAIPKILHGQIPYFTVCSACGLTHRARKVKMSFLKHARNRLNNMKEKQCTLISFAHINRCNIECRMKRDDTWLRYSIHPARGYHLPTENYNGYYGDILLKE